MRWSRSSFRAKGDISCDSRNRMFLLCKKTSIGVRGMKLAEGDRVSHAYMLETRQEYTIEYHDKPYTLNKVKLSRRDTKGIKPRI